MMMWMTMKLVASPFANLSNFRSDVSPHDVLVHVAVTNDSEIGWAPVSFEGRVTRCPWFCYARFSNTLLKD
jgi:hypothetical protein